MCVKLVNYLLVHKHGVLFFLQKKTKKKAISIKRDPLRKKPIEWTAQRSQILYTRYVHPIEKLSINQSITMFVISVIVIGKKLSSNLVSLYWRQSRRVWSEFISFRSERFWHEPADICKLFLCYSKVSKAEHTSKQASPLPPLPVVFT